ncbi:MAG: chromosomal replication initiator protein DnaA [Chloroflexi bacterium]|nr:MAG: chromosomal replication initiator protein DnaA [Chloroflexota bacterium]
MTPNAAWKATLGELELQMTKATFNTWLKDAHLLSCEENTYVVGVRNDYAKDWLQNRLRDTILRTLSAIQGQHVDVRFMVKADDMGNTAVSAPSNQNRITSNGSTPVTNNQSSEPRETPQKKGLPRINGVAITGRFTFSNFVVGPSNRLAHAAALSVAENPGQTYNPLFIYGGVGLGKTHLLHAVGHKCQQDGYNVCYITSETFTNDLVQSIRTKQMTQFRERYRTPDVLLIDDIQFIAGKESTQEELFHTFNELHSQGKQVIISSDRPPKAMVTLEERLQSRFEWGLMADIQQPDVEMRKAILQSKAEEKHIEVPDHIMDMIAQRIRNNIRELEGAFNKVAAYAQLSGGVVDSELVSMALGDLLHKPHQVTIDQIVDVVCRYYHVTPEELFSSSRKRKIAYPRQMVMYLARTETDASLPEIGNKLGKRDHTTILYGYEKISGKLDTDPEARRDSVAIKSTLYQAPQ